MKNSYNGAVGRDNSNGEHADYGEAKNPNTE